VENVESVKLSSSHDGDLDNSLSPFKRLSKDVLIYGTGRASIALISFIMLPIFSRIFSPSDYGVIETISAIAAAIMVFSTLGLDAASQRSFFDYREDQSSDRNVILSTTFWTLLIWSGILTLVSMLIIRKIDLGLEKSLPDILIIIAIATVPITVLHKFFKDILRMWHKPVAYMVVSILAALITIGAALYLVLGLELGLLGNYLGYFFGGFIALIVSYWLIRRALRFKFSTDYLKMMLSFGLPLVPVAAATWVLQLANRFFILMYSSQVELGIYGMSVRLSNVLMLLVTAFSVAFSPFILDLYSRDQVTEKHIRARTLTYVTVILCYGALILSVFAREFFLFYTDASFQGAYKAVGILCGSVVLVGMNVVIIAGITYSRKTFYFARYIILSALVSIGLNFLLIPSLGMVGAALASLVSYAILLILYYQRAQHLNKAPYEVSRVTLTLLITILLVVFGTLLHLQSLWLSLGIKTMIIIAYPIVIYIFVGLKSDERAFILRRIQNFRRKKT